MTSLKRCYLNDFINFFRFQASTLRQIVVSSLKKTLHLITISYNFNDFVLYLYHHGILGAVSDQRLQKQTVSKSCHDKEQTLSFTSHGRGATRPPPRDGGAEEFLGDPTVGPPPKVGPEIKYGRSSAKDGAPESSDEGQSKRWRVRFYS